MTSQQNNLNNELGVSHFYNTIPAFIFQIPQFRDNFVSKFPSIAPEVESFTRNPMCTCRKKIQEFITKNSIDTISFTNTFFIENLQLQDFMKDIAKQNMFEDVSGQIFVIEDNENAWKAFYDMSVEKDFRFRALNIVKDSNKLKIYFF